MRDCRRVERLLHQRFEASHVRIDTAADELFRVSPAEARRELEGLETSLLVRQDLVDWPAAGLVDTEKRCFMKLEVGYGEASIQS